MPIILYVVPLTAVVSVVYCSTRYELPERIFRSAATMFVKTMIGLVVLFGVLSYFSA